MIPSRYALITVDTEALANRASGDHVKRLIWGEFDKGTAGVREMCALGDEVGAKHVFFVDMCGEYCHPGEIAAVVIWLDAAGQDVQLHAHPEYLPKTFWLERGLPVAPAYMNDYDDARAECIINYCQETLFGITGKEPRAFRAGSFRWNAGTIRALGNAGIPLSFDNSSAALRNGQCLHSLPDNQPYTWSNGVIEVPASERLLLPRTWSRLQYPESRFLRYRPWWCSFLPFSVDRSAPFLVYLVHSWSLLQWDEKGHGAYVDDRRLEGYRKLLKRLSKDYDIITTAELPELFASGKIPLSHTEDLTRAELALYRQEMLARRRQRQADKQKAAAARK